MQFLQLMESADDIFFLIELLGGLTKTRLDFQVFLEVIFAGLAIQLEQVVELFHIKLVVAPELVGFLGRNLFDFLPFLLELLEFLVVSVGFLRRGHHRFNLLNDIELLLQVFLFFFLLLLEEFGALFLHQYHLSLEGLFFLVGSNYIFLGVSASIEISFLLSFALCEM